MVWKGYHQMLLNRGFAKDMYSLFEANIVSRPHCLVGKKMI